MLSLSRAVRQQLLNETLNFAVENSAFYRQHLGEDINSICDLDNLSRLPMIEKKQVVIHHEDILTSRTAPFHVGYSSGSTFKKAYERPFYSYLSREETKLQLSVWQQDPDLQTLRHSMCVQLFNPGHGAPLYQSEGMYYIPFSWQRDFPRVHEFLSRRHNFQDTSGKVEVLLGALNRIRLLYWLLEKHDISPYASYSLRKIGTYGRYISKCWHNRLADFFDTPIVMIHGLSEINGSATARCHECGSYHPRDELIAEYVDPNGEPVDEGYAELAYTTLLPFVRLQPYIRYRTGDLIQVGPQCPVAGAKGFNPLGRMSLALYRPEMGLTLPPGALLEYLDSCDGIYKRPHPSPDQFPDPEIFGHPAIKWNFTETSNCSPAMLTLFVELKANIYEQPEHRLKICQEWELDLRRRILGLDDLIETQKLSFSIEAVLPNCLGEDIVRGF